MPDRGIRKHYLIAIAARHHDQYGKKANSRFFPERTSSAEKARGSLPQMLLRAGGRFPLRLAYQMGQRAEDLDKRIGMVGIEKRLQEQGHDIVRPC